MRIKTATGVVALYMRACGFYGWASLWGTVYFLPGYEKSVSLIAHERTHLEQMERDGKVLFMVRYAWGMIRTLSYRNVPYEIEARAAAAKALRLVAMTEQPAVPRDGRRSDKRS